MSANQCPSTRDDNEEQILMGDNKILLLCCLHFTLNLQVLVTLLLSSCRHLLFDSFSLRCSRRLFF